MAILGDIKSYEGTIYLACCIGVEFDYDIVSHFIKYYKDLGVDEFLIILNTDEKDSEKLRYVKNILRRYDVEEKDIWQGRYLAHDHTTRIRNVIKRCTNEDDWVIIADVDEFNEYPLDLKKFVTYCDKEHCDCVMGEFVDRLTESGKIIEIDRKTDLWKAFPLKVDLREWNTVPYTKVVLNRSYVKTTLGNHGPIDNIDNNLPYHLNINHFKWRGHVIENQKEREENHRETNIPISIAAKGLQDYYRKYGTFKKDKHDIKL